MIHPERIPLLRGEGRYVDDIRLPGTAHVAFVRSPHAHARVVRVNVAAARAAPGVVAVFTGEDLAPHIRPIRARLEPPPTDRYRITEWHPIARERVRFVGEIVAVVVAEDRYEAEDAAEMAEVDYEALPAVSGVDAARAAGAPSLHSQAPDNVLYFTRRTAVADGCQDPFEHAPVKVHISVRHPRVAALSIEGAAALARFDPATSKLELTTSTQIPHLVRDGLSLCLDMDEERIRVIAPDVGGGFGPKAQLYPEEVVVVSPRAGAGSPGEMGARSGRASRRLLSRARRARGSGTRRRPDRHHSRGARASPVCGGGVLGVPVHQRARAPDHRRRAERAVPCAVLRLRRRRARHQRLPGRSLPRGRLPARSALHGDAARARRQGHRGGSGPGAAQEPGDAGRAPPARPDRRPL